MFSLDAQPLKSAEGQRHFPEAIWAFSMVARLELPLSLTAGEASVKQDPAFSIPAT